MDNYVDDRVLSLLTKRADGVIATIHMRYSEQFHTYPKQITMNNIQRLRLYNCPIEITTAS